jgi:hypothetical protein
MMVSLIMRSSNHNEQWKVIVMANTSLTSRNKFAKRHYDAIATAIQEARRRTNGSNDPIGVVVDELADAFAADNGMFKRERFKRACEPGANVRARN